MKRIAIVLIALLFAPVVHANEYVAAVDSVYDGDTLKVTVEVWPGLYKKTSIRIDGIDTPELRTRNACEKAMALKAKAALIDLAGDAVRLSNVRNGKYAGRVLAGVTTLDGKDVADEMMRTGLAREYHGGARAPWCK